MTPVEILIIGAGPAGLLAASYLAERHRVALIERGILGKTTKYWVTTERRLRNHGLKHCQLNRASSIVVGTYLGGQVRAQGDLAVVNDELLLQELVERCRHRNVLLSEKCSLLNLAWTQDRVRAQTTQEDFNARLVVDATGASSPIAITFRLHRLDGFFTVFGAHLRPIKLHSQDVVLAYANVLGDPPPILEVIPTGEGSAYCSVFTYSKRLTVPSALESTFRDQCLNNPFFQATQETEFIKGKAGVIQIGRRRRRQLPGVISLGEAGLIQPPLLGTAFNEILEYSKCICAHISRTLAQSSGLPERADFRYPVLKRTQDRLQLVLARLLLRGNVEAFDWLVRFMGELPQELVFKLCSNELRWKELVSISARLPRHLLFRSRWARLNRDSPAP